MSHDRKNAKTNLRTDTNDLTVRLANEAMDTDSGLLIVLTVVLETTEVKATTREDCIVVVFSCFSFKIARKSVRRLCNAEPNRHHGFES